MGAIRELIDYSAGMALASKADAELAAKDAELATLQLALQDMESQYLCGVELCRSKDAEIARLLEGLRECAYNVAAIARGERNSIC